MTDLIINLLLAGVEGAGLVLSPCILPVLPIVLATGVAGGKARPYGIMLGFIIAFCLFTLSARALVLATGINLDVVRYASFLVLLILAIIMMSTYLSTKFSQLTRIFSRYGASSAALAPNSGGFFNGILIGLPIGLIWTPCAGPIIAAVLVQTIRANTNLESVLLLTMFGLGVAIPMLLIILFGRTLLKQGNFLVKHSENIRKILGGVLFLAVILSMQGSLYVTDSGPKASSEQLQSDTLIAPLKKPYPAPKIEGISAWINSFPLDIGKLKGKVVLIDFWTYSCINCLRTLPYLKAWDKTYRDKGLVIIGVHSPEFAFEQNAENVRQALQQLGIHYPVALDNQLSTWSNYQNHYWPAHYLINRQGEVVYTHFGEGHYDITEHNIQVLLGDKSARVVSKPNDGLLSTPITPETYLGAERATRFSGTLSESNTMFHFPLILNINNWALQGPWQVTAQKITCVGHGCAIKLHFKAQKVFLVLAAPDKKTKTALILLNGNPINSIEGTHSLLIKTDRLYQLIGLPQTSEGVLELRFLEPGIEAYAFTFG